MGMDLSLPGRERLIRVACIAMRHTSLAHQNRSSTALQEQFQS